MKTIFEILTEADCVSFVSDHNAEKFSTTELTDGLRIFEHNNILDFKKEDVNNGVLYADGSYLIKSKCGIEFKITPWKNVVIQADMINRIIGLFNQHYFKAVDSADSHEFYEAALVARYMINELGCMGVIEDNYQQIKKQHE